MHHPGLALGTRDDPVDRLFHLEHRDLGLAASGRQQGSFVDQVGEIGSGEAGRPAGQNPQLDVGTQRLALGVDLEDPFPTEEIGGIDHDLAVEAPGPEQGRIEDVGPVGGGDDDDAVVGVEAVEFHQELVEGLLTFVVPATEAGTAMTADGIDFVDEHDRRSMALGLLEQISNSGGADADEHLDEIGPGDRKERNPGFTRHRLGQEGLARSRRPEEEDALRDLGAEGPVLVGILEEVLDLLKLFDRLGQAGHVVERDLGLLLGDHPGAGFPELHHPVPAPLHLHEDEDHEPEQEDPGQEAYQDRPEAIRLVVDLVEDSLLPQEFVELAFPAVGVVGDDVEAVARELRPDQSALNLIGPGEDLDGLDLTAVDLVEEPSDGDVAGLSDLVEPALCE